MTINQCKEMVYPLTKELCKIPASLGVPALCVGSYYGGGAHTREERINIESLNQGLDVAIELIKAYI